MKRKWKLPLGTIKGVEVTLHWSFLIVVAFLVAYPEARLLYGVAFASVLLHEFGHAAACWRSGIPCREITLHVLGGAAMAEIDYSTSVKNKYWGKMELQLALAGPAVSFLLALGFFLLAAISGFPYFLLLIALVNAFIMVLNLLPILPLDGGRALRAAITYFHGFDTGTRVTRWVSRLLLLVFFCLAAYYTLITNVIFVLIILLWGEAMAAMELELHSDYQKEIK